MSRRVETLHEWEARQVELSDVGARSLSNIAGDAISIVSCPSPHTYELRATSHVGTLVTPEVEVLIRPKIPLDNVFAMLEVGLPPQAWREEVFGYATTPDLLPAFAAFFGRCVEHAIAGGLVRSYREVRERLPAVRGRIDFSALLRAPERVAPMPCTFDEYTADVLENRILLAAIHRLLQVTGILPGTRCTLLRLATRFEDVHLTGLRPDIVDRVHFTRLNAHYRPALKLSRLALGSSSLLDQAGCTAANSFLIDMNDLFQRFVESRLRRLLRGRLDVVAEPTVWLGRGQQIRMLPDLVFEKKRSITYVGDVKYKVTDTGRNEDYYQLLAYVTALGLREGVLIYCAESGQPLPRRVEVRNSGALLHAHPIRASGRIEAVEASLAELADWIAVRAELGASIDFQRTASVA